VARERSKPICLIAAWTLKAPSPGFWASLRMASTAAKSAFLTPGGRPGDPSARPSNPFSFHLSRVR
jgi:hypothetical protein